MVGGDWYAWDMLPDGTIAVAIASTGTSGIEAGLTAATVRSAWQSHSGYRQTTGELLRRTNDTLWHTSTGEMTANILYANVDPDTGEASFASAGNCHAYVVNRYGYRSINSPSQPLGTDPDQRVETHSLRLLQGDSLVLASEGLIACNGAPQTGRVTQQQLTDVIRDDVSDGPEAALTQLRRKLANAEDLSFDRSVVILSRT